MIIQEENKKLIDIIIFNVSFDKATMFYSLYVTFFIMLIY